jgi:hypothetical protein
MVDLPPVLEFAIIAILAGLISYAIHLALSRSAVLMLMFNGARRKHDPVAASSGANAAKPQSISTDRPYPLRG